MNRQPVQSALWKRLVAIAAGAALLCPLPLAAQYRMRVPGMKNYSKMRTHSSTRAAMNASTRAALQKRAKARAARAKRAAGR